MVIDYAETRVKELEELLPALQWEARPEHPVRVLLLVRKTPQRSGDWTEALRNSGDSWLESVLDEATVRVLDHTKPNSDDREALFAAAVEAFASRGNPREAVPEAAPPDLTGEAFGNPLLIVTAAYLSVHGRNDMPSTRAGLLEGIIQHEDRYWASSADRDNADISKVLRRRIVALATLSGAKSEIEAAQVLHQLPELTDANAERRHRIAHWFHSLYPQPDYPGARWWNPLEPDLLGEYLVSTELSDFPEVLASVLGNEDAESLIRPPDTFARAAAYDGKLADAVRPILTAALERLCRTAVDQSSAGRELSAMLRSNLAISLNHAVSTIVPFPSALPGALGTLPSRPNIILKRTGTDSYRAACLRTAPPGPRCSSHGGCERG
ncbi:hypothetical protein [Arthrobacter sp. Z4-13]